MAVPLRRNRTEKDPTYTVKKSGSLLSDAEAGILRIGLWHIQGNSSNSHAMARILLDVRRADEDDLGLGGLGFGDFTSKTPSRVLEPVIYLNLPNPTFL